MALARTDPEWKRARREFSSIREHRVALIFREMIESDATHRYRRARSMRSGVKTSDVSWPVLESTSVTPTLKASERDEWIPALGTASCNGLTIFIT